MHGQSDDDALEESELLEEEDEDEDSDEVSDEDEDEDDSELAAADPVLLLGPEYPSLYQPPPLRTKDVRDTRRRTFSLPQAGQGGASAPIFWSSSKDASQSSH